MRPVVELPVRAVVPRVVRGLPQVLRLAGAFGAVSLLRLVSGPGQVSVEQGRGHPVGQDRRGRRAPDEVLPALGMIGGVDDAAGRYFRLVDRRDRLRVAGQLGAHPGELRRVHRGHLHHGDVDTGLIVQQLAAQRGGEPVDGVLGAAVGGLQRDAALAQRGPDLHDRPAVARPHPGQRRHRAVDEAQVSHLGDPAELLRGDLGERGEHRGEGHVDPHVDGSEGVLYLLRGRIHLGEIGDVRRDGERPAARPLHVARRAFQARLTACDQPERGPRAGRTAGPRPGLCPRSLR